MMERVNLIPDDVALTGLDRVLSLVNRRFLPVILSAVGIVVVLEGIAAGTQALTAYRATRRTRALEERRATLVAELESQRAFVGQLDRTEQELVQQVASLTKRVERLKSYQERPGEWTETLRDVKRALPYGVWLTELESSPRSGQLRMAGGAFNDDLVSQFMGALKENPRFFNVAFNYTKLGKIGRTGIVEFEISCQLERLARPLPA